MRLIMKQSFYLAICRFIRNLYKMSHKSTYIHSAMTLQRQLYRSLFRKCRFIDQNPALKNVCLSTPTHLMSLRGQAIEQISSINDYPITSRFSHSINNGAEYHLPRKSDPSMADILRSTFCQQRAIEMQSAFDGIKLLDNATQFLSHLVPNENTNVSGDRKFEVMDHLDRELLLKGNIAFIQHPMSVDFDRSDSKKKPFETRKVMVGFKLNIKGFEKVTFMQVMNKPMNQHLKVFMKRASRTIPEVFGRNDVFYGGISQTKINSMTNNPNCGGIPVLNDTLFLNPDRERTQELIKKGEAKANDFRFFIGFECFSDVLLHNILARNKYIAVNVCDSRLVSDILWNNEQMVKKKYIRNDMWRQMVQCLPEEIAQSWLQFPDTILDSEMFLNLSKGHKANIAAMLQDAKRQATDFVM